MTAILTAPFIPIAKNLSSHRAAQGVIYADQLKQAGIDLIVNMSLDRYHEDHNKFDEMYVYHGNDWSGHLNLFGGLKEFPHVDNFLNFSKFKGKVYSLVIPFPDYYDQLKHKVDLATEKNKEIDPRWLQIDWDNIKRMEQTAEVVDPNLIKTYRNISIGDSHAICMYRPGWMNYSVPFKTLHGALKMGLHTFIKPATAEFDNIEFYFGNIDVRHHLLRQLDPNQAVADIVAEYVKQAEEVADRWKARVTLYELLPIENERRHIPKTGWYEKTPFYGSRLERDKIRLLFRDELKKRVSDRVSVFEWVSRMINFEGELDFKYMEKPQSVHLSREYYPHWQGWEWNGLEKPINKPVNNNMATIENFL
jgi:hypothetical protein